MGQLTTIWDMNLLKPVEVVRINVPVVSPILSPVLLRLIPSLNNVAFSIDQVLYQGHPNQHQLQCPYHHPGADTLGQGDRICIMRIRFQLK